jgi:hypothetical protein
MDGASYPNKINFPRRKSCIGLTHITDAGLENLTGLAQLQDLDLRGTKITDAGVATLT